ncbi:hypothetical protein KSS87_005887 [Heliosperma pusillum]|nr:hypothetical protein KSS87_005887 [Heliosperma pusillum]
MTGGGADYCFECVGMSSLVQEAYACCRKGWGKTVILGVDQPKSEIKISFHDMLHNGKTLTGALFGGLKAKDDVPTLVNWYLDKIYVDDSRRADFGDGDCVDDLWWSRMVKGGRCLVVKGRPALGGEGEAGARW